MRSFFICHLSEKDQPEPPKENRRQIYIAEKKSGNQERDLEPA
jgi:hypothetical protein